MPIFIDGLHAFPLVPYSVKFSELNNLTNLESTKKHSRKQNADGIEVSGYSRWKNRRTGHQYADDLAISKRKLNH